MTLLSQGPALTTLPTALPLSISTSIFPVSLVDQDKFEHSKWPEKEQQPAWSQQVVWITSVGISHSKGNEKSPLSSEKGSKSSVMVSSFQVLLQFASLPTWPQFYTSVPKAMTWAQDTQPQERASLRGWPHYMLSASAKNSLSWGHEVVLGNNDNPRWEEDQCGRNTCSPVIKHEGFPDMFSHLILAVTLQNWYVLWLMMLHYRSLQNLVV